MTHAIAEKRSAQRFSLTSCAVFFAPTALLASFGAGCAFSATIFGLLRGLAITLALPGRDNRSRLTWAQCVENGTVPDLQTKVKQDPRRPNRGLSQSSASRLAAAARRHDGPSGLIRTKVFRAFDRQQVGKTRARAVDATLDRADSAIADRRGLFIREAGRANEDERLALIGRKLGKCRAEFLELHPAVLFGMRLQALRVAAVGVLDLTAALAILRAEEVAQDGEHPSRHVGAGLEGVDVGDRTQQRLLDEIVGTIDVAGQRDRERTQAWHRRQHGITQGGI